MTIPALPEKLTPVINYVVQGSENQFTFKFLVVNDDDMYVYQNGVQIPQRNYTITGINNDAGGEVTINTTLNPLSIGDVITLSRFTLPEQITEFLRLGDFTAEAVNAEFTRIYQLLQEFRRDISDSESSDRRLQEQISENREDIDKLGDLSAAAFKGVMEWKQGEQVTDRFQRYFYPNPTQGEPSYTWNAPLASDSNPITMGASPIGDNSWQQWDISEYQVKLISVLNYKSPDHMTAGNPVRSMIGSKVSTGLTEWIHTSGDGTLIDHYKPLTAIYADDWIDKLDASQGSRKAMAIASKFKKPLIYSAGGEVVFETMTDDYYCEWLPNVSIIVQDGTVLKAGSGINSGAKKLRAMFCQVDQANPLGVVGFKGEFDMNGASNLIASGDFNGTKNAAGLVLSADFVYIDAKVKNHAGRQCFSAGEAADLIKTVYVKRLECENVGAGLLGNNFQTDHSNIYCVADDFIVDAAKCSNEQEPPHVVTCIETHAKRTTVNNLHASNTTISYIVAAIEQDIESASIDNSACSGDMFVEPFTGVGREIGVLDIGDSNVFTKTFGTLSVIDLSSQMKGVGGVVSVGEMTFQNSKLTYGVTPVILLGKWKDTKIGKCLVGGADARFIQNGEILNAVSNLYVDGAITKKTNLSTAGITQLIRLTGSSSFGTVDIRNMKSKPTSGNANVGISVECPIETKMNIIDNDYHGDISTDVFDNSSPSDAGKFYVRHRGGPTIPGGGLKAAAGSEFYVEGVDMYRLIEDGNDWKRQPQKPREVNGTPVGGMLPFFVGEEVLDTQSKTWYKSMGILNSDWKAMT